MRSRILRKPNGAVIGIPERSSAYDVTETRRDEDGKTSAKGIESDVGSEIAVAVLCHYRGAASSFDNSALQAGIE